jgi:hypothetical protein
LVTRPYPRKHAARVVQGALRRPRHHVDASLRRGSLHGEQCRDIPLTVRFEDCQEGHGTELCEDDLRSLLAACSAHLASPGRPVLVDWTSQGVVVPRKTGR